MFNPFKPSAKAVDVNTEEQVIILFLQFPSTEEFGTEDERNNVYALEDAIEKVLDTNSDVDGHEFGEGQAIVYIFGIDAKSIWKSIESLVKAAPFAHWEALLRYGAVDDPDAKEERING